MQACQGTWQADIKRRDGVVVEEHEAELIAVLVVLRELGQIDSADPRRIEFCVQALGKIQYFATNGQGMVFRWMEHSLFVRDYISEI